MEFIKKFVINTFFIVAFIWICLTILGIITAIIGMIFLNTNPEQINQVMNTVIT